MKHGVADRRQADSPFTPLPAQQGELPAQVADAQLTTTGGSNLLTAGGPFFMAMDTKQLASLQELVDDQSATPDAWIAKEKLLRI